MRYLKAIPEDRGAHRSSNRGGIDADIEEKNREALQELLSEQNLLWALNKYVQPAEKRSSWPSAAISQDSSNVESLGGKPDNPGFVDRAAGSALDAAGKIWTLPNTLLGAVYGGLGHISGLLMGQNPEIRFGNNAIQFLHNPFVNRGSAFTLGNATVYGENPLGDEDIYPPDRTGAYGDHDVKFGKHEKAHTYQSQILGPLFLPAYLANGGLSGPKENPFEKAAQDYGAGRGKWWPW